jgi:hypothetical protein
MTMTDISGRPAVTEADGRAGGKGSRDRKKR